MRRASKRRAWLRSEGVRIALTFVGAIAFLSVIAALEGGCAPSARMRIAVQHECEVAARAEYQVTGDVDRAMSVYDRCMAGAR